MVKKILSVVVAFLMLFCTIPLSVFADDVLSVCPKCGERTYVQKTGLTVDACGIGVTYNSKHCNSCRYSYYDWVLFGVAGYKEFDSGSGDSLPDDFISEWIVKNFGKDVKFSQFQAGGGSASPGGVGRNPSGYSGQGVPTVNSSGVMFLSVPFEGYYRYSSFSSPDYIWMTDENYNNYSNSTYFHKKSYYAGSLSDDDSPSRALLLYTFTVPVDGVYYFGKYLNGYTIRRTIFYFKSGQSGEGETKFNYSDNNTYYQAKHFNKGDVVHFCFDLDARYDKIYKDHANNKDSCTLGKFWFYPALVCFEPDPDSSTLSNQTNIIINNNTWNGNIYVDNTNKLTYIYPQYTVNNETKISNNPIIYNEETKQYYTYDQTTNNYYYITYGDPAPTPTPSPSPDPGGSTPDPGKPTPTPTPGGSDSFGDGSSGNPFKWLGELFKDILEGILKGLWKIITSIFGFVLWLISLLFKLFPWMPNSALVALCGGVVVVTIIRIIKFITGR